MSTNPKCTQKIIANIAPLPALACEAVKMALVLS